MLFYDAPADELSAFAGSLAAPAAHAHVTD
jgi:hypothetical protein